MFFLPKGVPGDGNFTDLEDVIQIVTSVIFICSVGHAASNFGQYDDYAFPPNYPAILRGKPPTDKVRATSYIKLEHRAIFPKISYIDNILID